MFRSCIMVSALVVALGLLGAVKAEAHPKNNPGNGNKPQNKLQVTLKFNNGWKTGGSHFAHIRYNQRRWFDNCNCYCYLSLDDNCWYYWSEKDNCYYPMSMYPSGM